MKTNTITLVFVTLALLTTTTFAKIWRVDNNPSNINDFTDLQAANDGAAAGDTLYVYGSGTNYGNVTLDKTLYIFGPGYFLIENPETQATILRAATGKVTFASGSEGSLLTGFYVEGSTKISNSGGIAIQVDNIIIKRNHILRSLDVGTSNVIVIQNYISHSLSIGISSHNIIIHNNYISTFISMHAYASADIRNNLIFSTTGNSLNNSVFYNNIGNEGSFGFSNCDVQNNIGSSDQFGSLNGNQENVDMNTVFVGEGSTDGQWQLAPGSPAIGAGIAGEDCGMFGGDEPYVLSGLPAIPAIWYFDAPTSGSTNSGLQVNIKVKSHN